MSTGLLKGNIIVNDFIVGPPTVEDVAGATITVDDVMQSVRADLNGQFELANVKDSTLRITLQNGFTAFYTIDIIDNVDVTSVDFHLNPIFANTEDEGILVMPEPDMPANTIQIDSPNSSTDILCIEPGTDDSICVAELSGLVLGVSGLEQNGPFVHLVVRRLEIENSTYTIIQPNLPIDPATGSWSASLPLPTDGSKAFSGDRFSVAVVVSSIQIELDRFSLFQEIGGIESISESIEFRLVEN